ncbi:hypothetical protein ACFQH3_09480 [Haladaptatus sp. GCM10025707]|uniref:hypothetical protein n=1 Tax=unclassified Haladaptatus TaxID=2622732 RepID=UPI0023E82F74|nr:hypothetical protein [Haladaptatus sp. QDMS2]
MIWGVRVRDLINSPQGRNALIVAVALLLLVPLSVGFLGFAEITESPKPAPSVALSFEYDKSTETLTVVHESGDSLAGDRIWFRTANGRYLGEWEGPINAGDTLRLEGVPPEATVQVMWHAPKRNVDIIITEWHGPNAKV